MPGSPPTNVTEPGTSPPLSTRSSSPIPVGFGCHSCASTSEMGTGASRRPNNAADETFDTSSSSSTSVFQPSQPGQRPTHLGTLVPHSVQRNTARSLATATPYAPHETVVAPKRKVPPPKERHHTSGSYQRRPRECMRRRVRRRRLRYRRPITVAVRPTSARTKRVSRI